MCKLAGWLAGRLAVVVAVQVVVCKCSWCVSCQAHHSTPSFVLIHAECVLYSCANHTGPLFRRVWCSSLCRTTALSGGSWWWTGQHNHHSKQWAGACDSYLLEAAGEEVWGATNSIPRQPGAVAECLANAMRHTTCAGLMHLVRAIVGIYFSQSLSQLCTHHACNAVLVERASDTALCLRWRLGEAFRCHLAPTCPLSACPLCEGVG